MAGKDETPWQRQLLLGLGVLLAVGVLIGGIVAVALLKAADVTGIDKPQQSDSPQGPLIPSTAGQTTPPTSPPPDTSGHETTTQQTTEGKSGGQGDTQGKQHNKQHEKKEKKNKKQKSISLSAHPHSASTYQRVNLTGRWPGHNGVTLQVQRNLGDGWTDFPTSAQVRGGSFSTYIETGRSGKNRFRVVDGSGKKSNAVTVVIH